MKVGVNLLWMRHGIVGGSEGYTTSLLRSLPADRSHDVLLYVLPEFTEAHPDIADKFRMVQAPISGDRRPVRIGLEWSWLAARSARDRVSIVHHAGGTMPLVGKGHVLTILDLQYLTFPEYFSDLKRRYLQTLVPPSARRARVIVTPSNFVRESVVSRLGIDPARVAVVSHSVEDNPAELSSDVVSRLGLADRPYFLYPAITYPHKNHLRLLEAFADVCATNPDAMLVLTGGVARSEAAVRAEISQRRLGDHVVRAGRVGDDELDALYRNATALVFPSQYEGFGLPVLEAMARSCPALVANAGSLPEIAGDAAIVLDPHDSHVWAKAMTAILDGGERRAELIEAGHEVVRQFSASRTAAALIAAYEQAAEH